ncbi:MAG: hypothetical protein K1060chlam2_00490 [Chlamydiae bacterium]|nr:hypothetical protein [Chlamydiota bacterium]
MTQINRSTLSLRSTHSRLFQFFKAARRSEFIQKVVAALGSRVIVIVLGLFTSIFIARSLGPVGRGQFGVASAFTALGVQLGLLGFHSANTFHISKKPSLLSLLISNSLLISIVVGGASMVLLFFLRHPILGSNTIPLSLLILSLALIPMNICFLLFQGLLTGIQKFKEYNISDILIKAINTLLILAFVFIGSISVLHVTLFQVVATAICLVVMIRTFSKSIDSIQAPSLSLMRQNFFFGGKAYLACFFGWGITRVDVFILQRSQGFEQVGYFSVALSLLDYLLMFSAIVAGILYPKLCVESDIRKKWTMTKKTTLGSIVIILLSAIIAMLWKAPIRWIFGDEFAPCHLILVYLLPGFILLSIQTIMAQFIISIRFPWSLVFIWGSALGLKFIVSLGLIPQMGIRGIGISAILIYSYVFISVLINIKSILKHNVEAKELKG